MKNLSKKIKKYLKARVKAYGGKKSLKNPHIIAGILDDLAVDRYPVSVGEILRARDYLISHKNKK